MAQIQDYLPICSYLKILATIVLLYYSISKLDGLLAVRFLLVCLNRNLKFKQVFISIYLVDMILHLIISGYKHFYFFKINLIKFISPTP